MTTTIFQAETLVVAQASVDNTQALKIFCRENPDYDVFLTGALPNESEWVDDFLTDEPPAVFGWSRTLKLVATYTHDRDEIVAIIDVTLDMIVPGVGHIGLFQIAKKHYGSGLAQQLYVGLENWLIAQGMVALRLGVLDGNPRGMAFWVRHGFVETRLRNGTAPTGKQHQSHVLFKPLRPMTRDAYRTLVARDHPDTP
jgi:GNAT superfamily N-acetyltransferase